MDESKKQLVDKLKSSNNVLVTVGRNPSVDQLSALLGLTLFLNKQGKHAAAVFSGEIPSTIEFLQPEETFEKNTDSLRDFIIALDKSKADKLRYKVEDDVVRIFITPFKTSITQDDFEFSQGDFNVDLVVALGVSQQEDLDEAVVAHGKILHDATVTTISLTPDGGIGTINWHDPAASSLSELATELVEDLGKDQIDEQIATALLTGIVAETNRFSNDKTTAKTMSASAALMQAGANQQLVASKLQEGGSNLGAGTASDSAGSDDGTLEISHTDKDSDIQPIELPTPDESSIDLGDEAEDEQLAEDDTSSESEVTPGAHIITEPPTLGGTLTANTQQEGLDPSTDPFSAMSGGDKPQILERKDTPLAPPLPPPPPPPPAPDFTSLSPLLNPTTPEPPAAPSAASLSIPVPPPPPPPLAPEPPAVPEPQATESASPLPSAPTLTPPPVDWSAPKDDTSPSPPETPEPSSSGQYTTLADLEKMVDAEAPTSDSSANDSDDSKPDTSGLDAARDEVNRALNEANESNAPQVTDPTAPPPVPPPIPFQFGNQPPQQ